LYVNDIPEDTEQNLECDGSCPLKDPLSTTNHTEINTSFLTPQKPTEVQNSKTTIEETNF